MSVVLVALSACGSRTGFATGSNPQAAGSAAIDSSVDSQPTSSGGSGGSTGGSSGSGTSSGVDGSSSSGGDMGSSSGTIPVSCTDASTPSAPPSCASPGPGLTDCGGCKETCCASLAVPGGTFYRTYTNGGPGPVSTASDTATVSDFRLDRYLVTVGRFRQFVSAWTKGWTPAAGAGKHKHLNGQEGLTDSARSGTYEPGWLPANDADVAPTDANLACWDMFVTWTPSVGANESLPINCVTWEEAYAFCIWDGGFLPSEAEWDYVAAGGSEQRGYPWGAADPGTTSRFAIYGCLYPDGVAPPGSAVYPSLLGNCSQVPHNVANIRPVGSAPLGIGRWGQLDLAGEEQEWTLDLSASYANPCTDCVDATGGYDRVLRSGGFGDPASNLLATYRFANPSSQRNANFGFRCARTP